MSLLITVLAVLALPPRAPAELVGTWDVALYYSETAEPSSTVMVIDAEADGVLTGSFYGSAFGEARARVFQGEVIFTATTQDGSGAYLHSGRLASNGDMTGQTLSVGRDFLMGWTATRREGDAP